MDNHTPGWTFPDDTSTATKVGWSPLENRVWSETTPPHEGESDEGSYSICVVARDLESAWLRVVKIWEPVEEGADGIVEAMRD